MRRMLAELRGVSAVAYVSFWVLAVLYGAALLADVVAPHPYDAQYREYPLCPPSRVRWVDASGRLRPLPFVHPVRPVPGSFGRYAEDRSVVCPVRLFVRGPERRVLGLVRTDRWLVGAGAGGTLFLLGTDMHGRDVFSRILHGARISLSIGLIGVAISFFLGLLIGGVSGYLGGAVDAVLMRVVEIVMVFPAFYLMLALRATFPPNLSSVQVYLLIIVILSFIGWASLARIIRGMVLSLKEEEYVLAARALGLSNLRIVMRHLLPNTLSYTVTALTLSVPGYILGESALSLVGLGIQEPFPSWGNMLSVTVGNLRILTAAPWMLIPGLCIFVTVMAFNFLGDGLRTLLDPRSR